MFRSSLTSSSTYLSTQNANTHTHAVYLSTQNATHTHTKRYAAALPQITSTAHLSTQNTTHTHTKRYAAALTQITFTILKKPI